MEKETATIPYFVHEGEMTRMERTNKRLWIALLVIFVALIATNATWIIYENQFTEETISYEVQQDSSDGGTVNYTGNNIRITGGDFNGEADDPDLGNPAGLETGSGTEDLP